MRTQCRNFIRKRINAGSIHGKYHFGVFESSIDALCMPVCLHRESLLSKPLITSRCQPPAIGFRIWPQILLFYQRLHNR